MHRFSLILTTLLLLSDARPAAAQPDAPFSIQTADGKCEIIINTAATPDLKDWAKNKLAPVVTTWYPKIVARLPSDGFTAPSRCTITIKPMDGVASTTGTDVVVSAQWVRHQINGEAIGSVVHELVHVVQQFGSHGYTDQAPGWLVEGSADYIRWFEYEPQSHGADLVWLRQSHNLKPNYDGSYRITANFLNYTINKYDKNLIEEMNAAMREGRYSEDLWKKYTGKTAAELNTEWKADLASKLGIATQPAGT